MSVATPLHRRRRAPHPRPSRAVGAARLVPVVLALVLAGCGTAGGADRAGDTPTIVATTTILGDVAAELAGAAAQVTVLMDAGADPHSYEPSARDLAVIADADLIVANGSGLEAQLTGPIEEVERAGVPVFRATDHVDVLRADDDQADVVTDDPSGGEDEHGDHGQGATDPHFWMDPLRMAEAARALGGRIGSVTGARQRTADRTEDYVAALRALDRWISDTLADIPDPARVLVTNHDSLGYFADRYGFTVVGTVIPGGTTGAEPSARDIEELTNVIRDTGVRAIFTDTTAPEDLARTLAREAGGEVQVVRLYSGSLGDGADAGTYIDMLQTDAERIDRALAP